MPSVKRKRKNKPRKKSVYVYMCGITFLHEIGEGRKPIVEVYSSVARLRAEHPSLDRCGIVKVKVTEEEWVEPYGRDL
jgi:hypothetical protein